MEVQELQAMQELIKAFVAAKLEFPAIDKDSVVSVPTKSGGKYSYRYATLSNILSKVEPCLLKHGLVLTQLINSDGETITIVTQLWHIGGAKRESSYTLPKQKEFTYDMKAVGGAITYARRYAVTAMLSLAAEDDDDGEVGNAAQRPTSTRLAAKPLPVPSSPERERLMTAIQQFVDRDANWVKGIAAQMFGGISRQQMSDSQLGDLLKALTRQSEAVA